MPDNVGRGTEQVDAEAGKTIECWNFLNYLQQARCYQAGELYRCYLDISSDIWGLKHDLYQLHYFGNVSLQIVLTHMAWSFGGFLSFCLFFFFLILGTSP